MLIVYLVKQNILCVGIIDDGLPLSKKKIDLHHWTEGVVR